MSKQRANKTGKAGVLFFAIVVVFLIALAARLYPELKSPERYRYGIGSFGDSFVYHSIAFNLYKGNGFSATFADDMLGREGMSGNKIEYKPAIFRAPAYPFFLCFIYKFISNPDDMLSSLTWHRIWDRVRQCQCVLDAFTAVLVFLIAREIYSKSLWVPFFSGLLYCFSFYNIYYTRALLSEVLNTFFLTLLILSCVKVLKYQKPQSFLFCGFACGLVLLSRAEYILFFPLFALWQLFFGRNNFLSTLKKIAVYFLGIVLIVFPWTLRNYVVFKKPIIVSYGGWGGNIYFGAVLTKENWQLWWNENYQDNLFFDKEEKDEFLYNNQKFYRTLIDGSLAEINARDKVFLNLALKRIAKEPGRVVRNWVVKIPRLWYLNSIPFYRDPEPSGWFFVFYLLFAIIAIFRAKKSSKMLMSVIGILFLYLTIILIPFHVESRYSVVLMPGVICLAGIGLSGIVLPRKYFTTENT